MSIFWIPANPLRFKAQPSLLFRFGRFGRPEIVRLPIALRGNRTVPNPRTKGTTAGAGLAMPTNSRPGFLSGRSIHDPSYHCRSGQTSQKHDRPPMDKGIHLNPPKSSCRWHRKCNTMDSFLLFSRAIQATHLDRHQHLAADLCCNRNQGEVLDPDR